MFPQGDCPQMMIDRVCTRGKKVTAAGISLLAQSWPAGEDMIRRKGLAFDTDRINALFMRLQELARLPGTFLQDIMQKTCMCLPNDEHHTHKPPHTVCRRKNAYKDDNASKCYSECNKFTGRVRTFSPGLFSCFCASCRLLGVFQHEAI